MSFETPRNLEGERDTQPTSDELAALHFEFLRAASKRGTVEPAWQDLPNADGTVPQRYVLDLSRAPQQDLKAILHIDTNPEGLLVEVTEPHVIDAQVPGLIQNTFIRYSTQEEDGTVLHYFLISHDESRSEEWTSEYERYEDDGIVRPITQEELSNLQALMGYIEYAALCGHLKRS